MSGTLFVVATPIGNLEDITLRALRVLREADVIAAEDTRRTSRLLAHYSIPTPTLSFHEHNTRTRLPQVLARLERGENVALVSDAGTPGISDPGVELIRACSMKGFAVDPIPGASAPLAAAVASGFPLDPLTIFGFAPTRSVTRKKWLARLQAVPDTLTFFESPHRIEQAVSDIRLCFGERPIVIAREVTKVHQEFVRFTRGDEIGQTPAAKGEFTIVVGPAPAKAPLTAHATDALIFDEFCRMTSEAKGRRASLAAVAQKYGRSTKDVYAIVERLKKADV